MTCVRTLQEHYTFVPNITLLDTTSHDLTFIHMYAIIRFVLGKSSTYRGTRDQPTTTPCGSYL